MTNPTVRIHNAETDEVIERPMNAEEFAEFNEFVAAESKAADEAETKRLSKEALLKKLGITADEAALLLG